MHPPAALRHPYRAPTEVFRSGGWLRVPAFVPALPDRCVVCNGLASVRVHRTLHRIARPDSGLMFVLILCFCWPALFWIKPVFITFGLCSRDARRVRLAWATAAAAAAACFVAAFVAAHLKMPWLGVMLMVASFALAVIASRRHAVLRIRAREHEHVLIEVPPAFLASFEEKPN